ncbi:unnamed protein product [Gadus morhua 'NCC']
MDPSGFFVKRNAPHSISANHDAILHRKYRPKSTVDYIRGRTAPLSALVSFSGDCDDTIAHSALGPWSPTLTPATSSFCPWSSAPITPCLLYPTSLVLSLLSPLLPSLNP